MDRCQKCNLPLTTSAVCPNCGWSEFGQHDMTNLKDGKLSILRAELAALIAERDRLNELVDGIKEILSRQLYETVTVPLIEKLIAAQALESEERQ